MEPSPGPEPAPATRTPPRPEGLRARVHERIQATLKSALPRFPDGPESPGVLVGFSGGVDSTALLHLLRERILRGRGPGRPLLVAAHLDHRLRPDSGEQARFASGVARSLGLDFAVARSDVAGRARGEGRSVEEAGRLERFRFFGEISRRRGLEAVFLGHTLTDQAETVLLRLARGTGGLGLGAMAPSRSENGQEGLRVIRPLLEVSRAELVELADAEGWPHYEDPSNADPGFLRNRIRRQVLPLLREVVNPKVEAALGRAAEVAREDEAWLQSEAQRRFLETAEVDESGDAASVRIPVAVLRAAPPALRRRLVREGLRAARGHLRRLGLVHIEAALRVTLSGYGTASLDLPGAKFGVAGGVVTISAARNHSHEEAFPSPEKPAATDL